MKKQWRMKQMLRESLFSVLFIGLLSGSASAQTFNPPGFFEDTYPNVGPNISVTSHTSAYSTQWVSTAIGNVNLVLAGWDDVNPGNPAGVSWRLLQPGNPAVIMNQGIIPYSNVRDLEVGYVHTTTDPEMLVAYYLNGVGHMVDVYSLASGTPALLYTNVLSTMPFYTRISIDCHKQYATVIAWEDVNGINTVYGLSWSGPSIIFSGVLTLTGTTGETTVDVAFTHANTSLMAQYVYYNPSTGNITESSFDFWIGIYIPTPMFVGPNVQDINMVGSCRPCGEKVPKDIPLIKVCPYMNIDAPGHYNVDNWAYTYTTDNSNIDVRLLDLNTSPIAATVTVNNASALPSLPINSSSNLHPFCAYDVNCPGSGANINVAWYTNFVDPGLGSTAGYVGLRMNESGTALMSPPDYLTVANNPTWASMTPVLSISKADDSNPDYMYTIFPEYDPGFPGFRLENKYPKFCSNSYKGNPDAGTTTPIYTCNDEKNLAEFKRLHATTKTLGVSPNPFSSTFKIEVPGDYMNEVASIVLTDALGNVIAKYNGVAGEANTYFSTKTKSLAAGSYFLNMNIEGKVNETRKITKAE